MANDGKIRKEDLVSNDALSAYDALEQKAVKALKGIAEALDKLQKAESKVGITTGQQTEIAKKRNVKLTEAEKLTKKLATAKEKLKLVSTQQNKELQRTTAQLSKQNAQIKKNINGSKTLTGTFKSLLRSMVAFIGVRMFIQSIKDVFELTKKLDSLSFAMKAVIKDEIELAQTQEWLKQITNAFGAELVSTTERYIKFRAASMQAGLSAKETQKIFGTMTKAAGVLGLKTDELRGIYLALEQMISKGKITTEELRRQLGERLPGAMDIMADSLGITTAKLDDMMKKGLVISKDVLPLFAEQVEKAYGIENVEKVETLVAAQIRLENSWIDLVKGFKEGNDVSKKVIAVFDFLSSNLAKIVEVAYSSIKAFVIYKTLMTANAVMIKLYTARIAAATIVETLRTAGLRAAVVQMWSLNAATAANPIGALLTVLVATVAVLWSFKDILFSSATAQEKLNEAIKKGREEADASTKKLNALVAIQISMIKKREIATLSEAKTDNEANEIKRKSIEEQIKLLKQAKNAEAIVYQSLKKEVKEANSLSEAERKLYKITDIAIAEKNITMKSAAASYINLQDRIAKLQRELKGEGKVIENSVKWYRNLIKTNNELLELTTKRKDAIVLQQQNAKWELEIIRILGVKKKKTKDLADLENKVAIGRIKKVIETNNVIIESDKATYQEKVDALVEVTLREQRILELQRQDKLDAVKDDKNAANNKLLINQDYQAKLVELETKTKVELSKLEDDEFKRLKTRIDNKKNELDIAYGEELKLIHATSKSKEEVDKRTGELNLKYKRLELAATIEIVKATILQFKANKMTTVELEKMLKNLDSISFSAFTKGKDDLEDFKEALSAVSDILGSLSDILANASDGNIIAYEKEKDALEELYDRKQELAKGDADTQEALDKELEAKKKVIDKKIKKEKERQWKVDQKVALAQAAINIALALTDPSVIINPFRIALVAAVGAFQLAAIVSQPMPKFAEGGIMGYDGKALINDGGRREFVERNGSVFSSPIKNAVVDLQKGDVIHKDMNALMNASIMTSLVNDSNNLDPSKLKVIFDDNYGNLENVIKRGFKGVSTNIKLTQQKVDIPQALYKNSHIKWD